MPPKVLGAKSSLLRHSFPSFYACYLLKSVQTPQSTATYIGSTPSPPRRIRQHNGELTQGARKTRSKRPWVMQMIVHGFPSRLAALQFEWAWQHPHKSRHLKDENGRVFGDRAAKVTKKNIAIVRTMISRRPFNTWPLHVKLFTEEAVRHWNAAATSGAPALPPGFTCSIELEGVDGKSGHAGSGRQGPIAVDDVDFTSAYLAKNTTLIASGRRLHCDICHKELHNYATEPLSTALCPSPTCISVSHHACLSEHFLMEQPVLTESLMIPRGGHCPSCRNYILWGDVVKGSYRRLPPVDASGTVDIVSADDMFLSDEVDEEILETPKKKKKTSSVKAKSAPRLSSPSSKRPKSSKSKGKAKVSPSGSGTRPKSRSSSPESGSSSEGKEFDLANIVASSEGEQSTPRKLGRPRKEVVLLSPRSAAGILSPPGLTPKKARGRPRKATGDSSEGEQFDFTNIASSSEDEKPKRGRPGKEKAVLAPALGVSSPKKKDKKAPGRPRKATASSSEGEQFDFSNIFSSSDSEGEKRKRGRPWKAEGLPKSPIKSPKARKLIVEQGVPSGSKSVQRSRGRPPKDVPMSPPSPVSTKKRKPTAAVQASPAGKKKFHTQVPDRPAKDMQIDSSSGEFFDFEGLTDEDVSDEDFEAFIARRANPKLLVTPKPNLKRPRSGKSRDKHLRMTTPPDIWMEEEDLEQSMSALSVSSPTRSPFPGQPWRRDPQIIELSD